MAKEYKDSGIPWIGEIPKEWEIVQLKRYAKVKNGKEIPVELNIDDENAKPVYGSGGIFKYTNETLYSGEAVMFGRKGTLGKPIYVNDSFWVVDTMYYLTYQIKLFPKYDYYQLLAFDWNPYITQTAIPSIVASDVMGAFVCVPSLTEQQRIAEFLDRKCGEIDEAIALQEEFIEELKAYKQSVITEAVTRGLNPNVKFKDSGIDWIGKIPQGWKIHFLKRVINRPLQYGANESGIPYEDNLPRYVRITDILDNSLKEDILKLSLTEEQAKDYILEDGDILFARSGGTVGKAFIYKASYGRCAFAGYLIKASISSSNDPKFVFYYTQSSSYEEWKKRIFIQSTIQNIGADRYSMMEMPIPPLSEQQQIADYLDNKCTEIDSLIAIKQQKIEELKDYKKSVIYEYVTGKKEVK